MGRFEHLELGDWLPKHPEDAPESGVIDQHYYMEKADAAFADENYERAMAYYSRALQYDINLEAAWVGQLRCLIELRELQEALIWANRALERFPNGSQILAARAVAESRMGKSTAALSYSDGAFAAQGSTPYTWVARGEALVAINVENSKACFGKAIEMTPSDWAVRAWIGNAYLVHGRYHQALEHLKEAVRLDPNRFTCWYWAGRCSEALGDTAEAIRAYQRALAIQPQFNRARDALSRMQNRSVTDKLGTGIKRIFLSRHNK